jgi:hypothetical protein
MSTDHAGLAIVTSGEPIASEVFLSHPTRVFNLDDVREFAVFYRFFSVVRVPIDSLLACGVN